MENERQFDNLIEDNPLLKESLMAMAKDEEIIFPEVQKILENLEKLVLDKNSSFDIKHALLTLSRCIRYITSSFSEDIELFEKEIDRSNYLITDIMLPAIMENKEAENLDMSDIRLILSASTLIDYVFLRELFDVNN